MRHVRWPRLHFNIRSNSWRSHELETRGLQIQYSRFALLSREQRFRPPLNDSPCAISHSCYAARLGTLQSTYQRLLWKPCSPGRMASTMPHLRTYYSPHARTVALQSVEHGCKAHYKSAHHTPRQGGCSNPHAATMTISILFVLLHVFSLALARWLVCYPHSAGTGGAPTLRRDTNNHVAELRYRTSRKLTRTLLDCNMPAISVEIDQRCAELDSAIFQSVRAQQPQRLPEQREH